MNGLKKTHNKRLEDLQECQIPCLVMISEGEIKTDQLPLAKSIKRTLAKPWNYYIKKRIKVMERWYKNYTLSRRKDSHLINKKANSITTDLHAGDWVHVRSKEEIGKTLDRWKELNGCAFLACMWEYCGTNQRVLQRMNRFLDERDYKVKKCTGIVLLEGVICHGTPVFGRCDRGCHLFWREEWLEKNETPVVGD